MPLIGAMQDSDFKVLGPKIIPQQALSYETSNPTQSLYSPRLVLPSVSVKKNPALSGIALRSQCR